MNNRSGYFVFAKFRQSKAMWESRVSIVSVNPISHTFKVITTNCFEITENDHRSMMRVCCVKGSFSSIKNFGGTETNIR